MEAQASQINQNSSWVNYKGSWITNIVILIFIKITFSIIPGISPEASWTLTNLAYNATSFIMFHYLTGTPFEWNQGEQDELTLWEQIDNGAQFTPTKKFLTAVPIVLFLLSTHYTHYDLPTFSVNLVFVLVSLIAKLPSMHRVRLFGGKVEEEERSKDE